MMGNYSGMFGMGFMTFGFWIAMALIIIGVVLLVSLLVKNSFNENKHDDSALKILDRRYAEGKIDDVEYKKRKNDLLNE